MLSGPNPHLRDTIITAGAQIRAARALLGVTRQQLAVAAGLHRNAIAYWERRDAIPFPPAGSQPHACRIIGQTLRVNGVVMVHEPGPGVALKAPPSMGEITGAIDAKLSEFLSMSRAQLPAS